MVLEDTKLQMKWLTGRILKVFPGEDGLVRTAEVLVTTAPEREPGDSTIKRQPKDIKIKRSIYRRPVTKLAPLISASPLTF